MEVLRLCACELIKSRPWRLFRSYLPLPGMVALACCCRGKAAIIQCLVLVRSWMLQVMMLLVCCVLMSVHSSRTSVMLVFDVVLDNGAIARRKISLHLDIQVNLFRLVGVARILRLRAGRVLGAILFGRLERRRRLAE